MGPVLHRSLAILLIATIAAFWMRDDELTGIAVGVTTLSIAYLKGRLVVLDFMELRDAPIVWRALLEGWLAGVTTLLLLGYFLGRGWA